MHAYSHYSWVGHRRWRIGLALLLIVLTAAGCRAMNSGAQPSGAAAERVTVAPVQNAAFATTRTYTGNVQAESAINVLPKVTGHVEQIFVDVGSVVRRGRPDCRPRPQRAWGQRAAGRRRAPGRPGPARPRDRAGTARERPAGAGPVDGGRGAAGPAPGRGTGRPISLRRNRIWRRRRPSSASSWTGASTRKSSPPRPPSRRPAPAC